MEDSTDAYDDECMSCRETYSTLRIFSESIAPAEISAALRLEPTRSHLKGEAISPRVPRPRPQHGWLLSSENQVRSRDTRRHIDWILDRLEPCALAFDGLLSRGASVDIFSFWSSARGQGGPILSPPQLVRLARFRLEIVYDIYFSDHDDDDALADPVGGLVIPAGWTTTYRDPSLSSPVWELKEDLLQLHHAGLDRIADLGWYGDHYAVVVFEHDFEGQLLGKVRASSPPEAIAALLSLLKTFGA